MKRLTLIFLTLMCLTARAQTVTATWQFSDIEDPAACVVSDALVTPAYTQGASLSLCQTLKNCGAAEGYTGVTYDPWFVTLQPAEQVSAATAGHCVTFSVTPVDDNKFKPTLVSFDCCRVGTDGGYIEVVAADGSNSVTLATGQRPARNKISADTSTGYTHYEFNVNDFNVQGEAFSLIIYIYGVATNKDYGLRNIVIQGEMNSQIYTAADYLTAFGFGDTDLTALVADLKNGGSAHYSTKLYADPTDFVATLAPEYANCTATVTYADKTATVTITQEDSVVFTFSVTFTVSNLPQKAEATPLKRGLMAVHSSGNLVSWRARKGDDANTSFMLYRGTTALNSGNPISGKTNYLDSGGSTSSTYILHVLDAQGNVAETDTCTAWSSQTLYIPLTAGAPTDPTTYGATYTPNDCSYCDMDGDGEYEIIVKWSPSNEKDAASSGNTSNVFFDCYKLDGTQLWRIDMGQNFFASAHTMQFIAWDFDGDGYGEFMAKTAPGTVDGQGNYVIMGDDDPTANWKNSRGKQVEGPEYITVFDGMTGAELATIAYHTDYAAGESYWGDSNQNRSERYLAAIAWLDGEDANPCPIFARGYYSGAFVAAYDWDGVTLSERWVSRNTSSGKGLWGEGAHWISVADCDGDGKQEIVYGSAALDHDGSLLYRTGLGHGDALHVGDFDPDNDGLEVFMAHEHSPYGVDLRDAATGNILVRQTASGDTGRGLIAHYDSESDGAYFHSSADQTTLYDWDGEAVVSGLDFRASLNNRVYWNGLLTDDYYDKSILINYDASTKGLGRMQVNGTYYTVGTLNNSTKYNPCVLGDLLGDWREEIVTWTESDGTYYLIVNATNYATDYTVPHLMDDLAYRAQVIGQNVCYNQPPHLGYNLRESKKLTRELVADDAGWYWDCLYTTYPVVIPDGVQAWKVTGRKSTNSVDTLSTTKLSSGTVIAAGTGIVYRSQSATATFVPSALTANTMSSSVILGSYIDTVLPADEEKTAYYEWRIGDRGPGFYRAGGSTVGGRTGYVQFKGTTALPLSDSYVMGISVNNTLATGVSAAEADKPDGKTYTLGGTQATSADKGIVVSGGGKWLK